MAELVVGVAASHSPQLSTRPEKWFQHAERDVSNQSLIGRDGKQHTYAEVLTEDVIVPGIEAHLTAQAFDEKYRRMQRGMQACSSALAGAEPTCAVVIGNDHKEMYGDDSMPAFAVYLGDFIVDRPLSQARLENMPASLRDPQWAYHGTEPEIYPVASKLAHHITAQLCENGFDPAQASAQQEGRILGHAWTFPRRRMMPERMPAVVPIHVNTLYPPNQPSPRRCHQFGRAIAEAIRSFPGDDRVAVVTSGGLSHFVVDEALDRATLDALLKEDGEALAALPRQKLNSGTSEILNWVALGGAVTGLLMEVIDYVPAYRSPAGTGVGMAFATWT